MSVRRRGRRRHHRALTRALGARSIVTDATVAALLALLATGCVTRAAQLPVRAVAFIDSASSSVDPASLRGTQLPPLPPRSPLLSETPPATRRIAELDAADAEIRDVAARIAGQFDLDVVVDPEVRGRVTAHLENVTLEHALAEVVVARGYRYTVLGRTLRVTPVKLETRVFPLDYVALSRIGTASSVVQRRLGPMTTQTGTSGETPATYGQTPEQLPGSDVITTVSVSDLWREVKVALDGLLGAPVSPAPMATSVRLAAADPGSTDDRSGAFGRSYPDGARLLVSPLSGLITVTATPERLAEVRTFMDAFRSSVLRQVVIEARFVEVELSPEHGNGIDWLAVARDVRNDGVVFDAGGSTVVLSSRGAAMPRALSGGRPQIDPLIRAFAAQGRVRILSSPTLSALNNQRAIFDVTTDEPVYSGNQSSRSADGQAAGVAPMQPQQLSVGVVLDVLPQISSDSVLTMNVRPVVTSLDRVERFKNSDGSQTRVPVVSRREGDTVIRVHSGETVIMSGLVQTQRSTSVSGVPLLKDVPGLGRAFRRVSDAERRVELVVFLTATVVTAPSQSGR
jgi:MSHA biogenesis protein MshL